jgi:ketosteroid isomerase-like protein
MESGFVTLNASAVRDAVAAYYDAVRKGEIERIAGMFAADGVMRDPVGAPPAADGAARRQRYAGISAVFAEFGIFEEQIIVGGDEAAARWTARGTAKNGASVRFDGISTFAFDGAGKIAMMSAYFDVAAVVAAMSGAG